MHFKWGSERKLGGGDEPPIFVRIEFDKLHHAVTDPRPFNKHQKGFVNPQPIPITLIIESILQINAQAILRIRTRENFRLKITNRFLI